MSARPSLRRYRLVVRSAFLPSWCLSSPFRAPPPPRPSLSSSFFRCVCVCVFFSPSLVFLGLPLPLRILLLFCLLLHLAPPAMCATHFGLCAFAFALPLASPTGFGVASSLGRGRESWAPLFLGCRALAPYMMYGRAAPCCSATRCVCALRPLREELCFGVPVGLSLTRAVLALQLGSATQRVEL